MSANYPNNYPSNTDCIWIITVERGHRVDLQFVDFDVEGSTIRCGYDYVAVSGISVTDAVIFGVTSRHVISDAIIIINLVVSMQTDESQRARLVC